jgi:hypothetical protein
MVNAPLREMVSRRFTGGATMEIGALGAAWCRFTQRPTNVPAAFAQILGKLHFFELRENLQRILLDYAQKRSGRANAAFNCPY